jgi:cephalosporin-C deacetylase-like acetyl esterase
MGGCKMERILCHSFQKSLEYLLEKYAQKDEEVSKMFLYRDIPAIKARMAKIKEEFQKKVSLDIEKCSLDPQITGEFIFPEYKLTKLMLQSMPDYYIPVHIYSPINLKEKNPALLITLGHYLEGKAKPENQIMCANLAMQGFVVATVDPPGLGERDMYPDKPGEESDYYPVMEHMWIGLLLNMIGENLSSYFLWDNTRVIDYLCSLPYVDKDRVGMTGQSGGGAQTLQLGAMDDRLSAISPIQIVEKDLFTQRYSIGDCEQTIFGLNSDFTIELYNLLWAAYPKKILLNSDRKDAMPEALEYIEHEMRRLYKILGKEDDFSLQIADCGHEISKETREIAYTWFGKIFGGTGGDIVEEKETNILELDELKCFPENFNKYDAFALSKHRLALAREKSALDKRPMITKVKEILGGYTDTYTVDLVTDRKDYSEFILHTLKNEYVVCLLKKGDKDNSRLKVVIDSTGIIPEKDDENVLNLIPFGIYYADNKKEHVHDFETITADINFYNGQVLFKKRLIEVITALSYASSALGYTQIEIAGSKQGGLLALCAALYCPVTGVDAVNTLASFESCFENKEYILDETSVIPGLLNICDIPELAELTNVSVRFINPIAEDKSIISPEAAGSYFGFDNKKGNVSIEWIYS